MTKQPAKKWDTASNEAVAPTIFIIFGATGDLAQKKLFPSFFDLYLKKILPEKFLIVAFARRDYSDDSYRELVREAILLKKHDADQQKLSDFISKISYIKGDFEDMASYKNLASRLEKQDKRGPRPTCCQARRYDLRTPQPRSAVRHLPRIPQQ